MSRSAASLFQLLLLSMFFYHDILRRSVMFAAAATGRDPSVTSHISARSGSHPLRPPAHRVSCKGPLMIPESNLSQITFALSALCLMFYGYQTWKSTCGWEEIYVATIEVRTPRKPCSAASVYLRTFASKTRIRVLQLQMIKFIIEYFHVSSWCEAA